MEEFRSTEILDKEIQADARKKAEKILAKADVDCALLLEEVSGRIEKAKKELEDKYSLKITALPGSMMPGAILSAATSPVEDCLSSNMMKGIGAPFSQTLI